MHFTRLWELDERFGLLAIIEETPDNFRQADFSLLILLDECVGDYVLIEITADVDRFIVTADKDALDRRRRCSQNISTARSSASSGIKPFRRSGGCFSTAVTMVYATLCITALITLCSRSIRWVVRFNTGEEVPRQSELSPITR